MSVRHLSSKTNPWVKFVKDLVNDNSAYKHHNRIWLEGDHLCLAAIRRGWTLDEVVIRESKLQESEDDWLTKADTTTVLTDSLMDHICAFGASTWIGAIVSLPQHQTIDSQVSTVVLDRLQDPGNAGSILRSAAAFGFKQLITTPATVALWSPKVVRSAMGAHFGIRLFESVSHDQLTNLGLPILVTSSHEGVFLHELVRQKHLPHPCLWVLGHEGQGASAEWFDKAKFKVRIAQPGGEESLNVAAAAAICLHASACQ